MINKKRIMHLKHDFFLIVIKLKKDRCNPSQKNKYSSREIEGLIDKKSSFERRMVG